MMKRFGRWTAALAAAGLAAALLLPGAMHAQDEETPEVVLEAYSQGFYRPTVLYTASMSDSLTPQQRVAARDFDGRLRFALEWSGYVNLVTEESKKRVGPAEMPGADEPPGTELRVRLHRREGEPLATLTLAEPGGEPFYRGSIPFDLASAGANADVAAEEVLRQLTGMTPPFRSRIAAVQAFPGNIKELVIMAYDGGQKWQVTHDQSIALSPSWSPDGRKIVFCSFRGGEDADLWIADLDERRIRRLLRRVGTDAAPAWSPDGNWILFAGSNGSVTKLYLVRPDGSDLRKLTTGSGIDTSPSWSPTGREIVFMSDRRGTPQIYRMDIDGANLRRLTYEGRYNADPAWSPAGDRIVYVRRENNGFQIRSMDPTGDVDVPLTDEPGDHLEPSFSPDGMKISYGYRGKVWVMNADGTLRRPLLSAGLMPDWSPIPGVDGE